jgi:uncharacterized protein
MEPESCRLPTRPDTDLESVIHRMLAGKRIAVVGLSDDPTRPSHDVAEYLVAAGYEVLPVNPTHATVMGRKSYASLADVPGPIDVVDVFRRPEHCADVVRQAIAVGAKGVWLQQGVRNAEAQRLAQEAGIDFVQDRCLKVDHMMRR